MITDFCCWVPLSIMAFINFAGVRLSPEAYAVSAIVLLPINSSLNPIIYSNLLDKILDLIRHLRKQMKGSGTTVTSTSSSFT